jgi:hypothetical protein
VVLSSVFLPPLFSVPQALTRRCCVGVKEICFPFFVAGKNWGMDLIEKGHGADLNEGTDLA